MDKFEQKKLIEVVLYILNKTDGIDYYRLFKILYLSERNHLANWGNKIIMDKFVAMDKGPVPTELYDLVRNKKLGSEDFQKMFNDAISHSSTIKYELKANRKADEDYLSESEKEELDKIIPIIQNESFGKIKEESHDKAWNNAYHKSKYNRFLKPSEMAEVAGASKEMADYVNEGICFANALR